MNVYPFIEAEKSQQRNVARACVLPQVSRSAFSANRTAAQSQRKRDDAELTDAIVAVHDESTGTCGAPRVHYPLWSFGVLVVCSHTANRRRTFGRGGMQLPHQPGQGGPQRTRWHPV